MLYQPIHQLMTLPVHLTLKYHVFPYPLPLHPLTFHLPLNYHVLKASHFTCTLLSITMCFLTPSHSTSLSTSCPPTPPNSQVLSTSSHPPSPPCFQLPHCLSLHVPHQLPPSPSQCPGLSCSCSPFPLQSLSPLLSPSPL